MTISNDTILCIDVLEGLRSLQDNSVNLVITSPPYADIRKSYTGVPPEKYVDWFLPIGREILRVLTKDGSFILNIKDKCKNGERIPYVFELVYRLRAEVGFKFIDTLIWAKKNGLAQTTSRRAADYFEYIFHFSKSVSPIWNVDEIRTPYPESSLKRAQKPIKNNTSNREARLSTGVSEYKEWKLHPKGAYPKNVLFFQKDSGKDHVAAFHPDLPTYFIKAHSNPGDLVLDPFCGRGTSCFSAKNLGRHYLGFDNKPEHIELAKTKYGL